MGHEELVKINLSNATIDGILTIPKNSRSIVVFAHGSGSGRLSSRNQFVAKMLREGKLATLLIDLLTAEEEIFDLQTRKLRFDIQLLANRVLEVTDWLKENEKTQLLKVGYFGASTGAAAALVAAANRTDDIKVVVSRGGRPDLAGAMLSCVKAPTLLIVGGDDVGVIELNESAKKQMQCEVKLEIVPGATHLFEEPGTLEQVGELSRAWFKAHFSQGHS
jgi:dienelactone hydrolase